jgi:hypothetical protein
MCEVFAHLEMPDTASVKMAALQGAARFDGAAASFRILASKVATEYSWIRNAVKGVAFADAAREVHLPPDSEIVKAVTAELLRDQLDGVLRSCADSLSKFADRLRAVSTRLAGINVLPDLEYAEAHSLISDWRTLVMRGQYVSSVCLHSARATA